MVFIYLASAGSRGLYETEQPIPHLQVVVPALDIGAFPDCFGEPPNDMPRHSESK